MSEKDDLISLGEKIKHAILSHNYKSVYQFTHSLNNDDLKRSTVYDIVSGKSNPTYLQLQKIAKVLGISLSDLLK